MDVIYLLTNIAYTNSRVKQGRGSVAIYNTGTHTHICINL